MFLNPFLVIIILFEYVIKKTYYNILMIDTNLNTDYGIYCLKDLFISLISYKYK